MSSAFRFSDGDYVEWIDRETFAYVQSNRSAHVWIDYEPGFFRSGRIIRTKSLKNWIDADSKKAIDAISEADEILITERLMEYFYSKGKKVRVDSSPLPVDSPL
jgi:hypothetical protein